VCKVTYTLRRSRELQQMQVLSWKCSFCTSAPRQTTRRPLFRTSRALGEPRQSCKTMFNREL
jgi:hypothetical protein